MSTARYFQDELSYLKESGEEFAQYFPKLTRYLSSKSTDPDVERLLEGFAFLTSRLREKIDDHLPEVTQSLLTLLWPNFLRPVPSMTIMEFKPVPGSISEAQVLEKGTEIESIEIDGTICSFTTSYETEILPLKITNVNHDISRDASVITICFKTLADEGIHSINLHNLRLYFGGSTYSAITSNLWLHRYLHKATVKSSVDSDDGIQINKENIIQVGFKVDEDVLPYPKNAFDGYRLLQEYFSLPQKYFFVDFLDIPLSHIKSGQSDFVLSLEFSRPIPPDVRIYKDSFKLHCVPAINLFEHDAEPILLDGRRLEYLIEPAMRDASDIDVFEVTSVTGWVPNNDGKSGGISRKFGRFESFAHEIERVEGRSVVYFRERVRQAISGERIDRLITFVREDETISIREGETISMRLLCSNGKAPSGLAVGEISRPTHTTPSFVTPRNITRPSEPCYPVVDGTLQWQLISALSLNYLSLQDADALRSILHVFDFGSKVDRQREREAVRRLEGIQSIQSATVDRLFKGLPVRGMRSTIEMKESHFASEGEMYLFATVLAQFFALYSTINSYHELVVNGLEAGEEYRWMARIGNQPLI